MNNKTLYLIIQQSEDDIDVIYASFSRRKRDKILNKCRLVENDTNLFYDKIIVINSEKYIPTIDLEILKECEEG